MAQAGFTPISLYYSTTAATSPTAGDLVNGELAINITDGRLFYKDNLGVVQLLASKAASNPVSTISFGTTGLTPNTATSGDITVGGTLALANGGTGATTAPAARTALGATTVGSNLFTLANPSAVSFLQLNADNSVSTLDAAAFRTAIGVGSGTVTSVSAALPLISSGGSTPTISLAGTVSVSNGGTGIGTVPTAGQIPIGNGSTYTAATLTAGAGMTITNAAGSVTVAGTGTTIKAQTTTYTLIASDAGKMISTTAGVTIPASVMAAGNIINIYNDSGASITLTSGAGLTLQWAGQTTSTTGDRTLGLYGMATITFITPTLAVIVGAGVA